MNDTSIEAMRDMWKIVDGDCREDDGLITYHVSAFDEGYKAAQAEQSVRIAELEAQLAELKRPRGYHDVEEFYKD